MAFTVRTNSPFRADIVGSFLRPDILKNARKLHSQGLLDDAGLKKVEDECITDLIKKQVAHGLKVITDGEFRRSWWHLDFMWGLGGVQKIAAESGYNFVGIQTRAEAAVIIGKLSGDNHPFVEHFNFVKQFESLAHGLVARITIPAPAQTLLNFIMIPKTAATTTWKDFYASEDELIDGIAAAYHTVINDLYAAGCRSLQFDDTTWSVLCDEKLVSSRGWDVDHLASINLKANNKALEAKPKDMVITTHTCRGNFRSHYASTGSYDRIAGVFFAHENVDAFYLEYDDERSGTFEALKLIPKDKKVVLGIITSKDPKLEDQKLLEKRVYEAAEYFPLDNLCVSPQCGFASTEEGNELTEQQQWDKVDLVVSTAQKIWG